jgi:predicted DNA-binding transcriptional regulator YafY
MRASRLLAILILLQMRGRVTAAYLADEFEVSERTIYRDIDALSMAGVPVYGDRGPGGGSALLDGYRTRLTGLADDEAAALALAGVPSAAAAAGLGVALRDGFGKVLLALPGDGAARAGQAAARFHVDPADWYRSADALPHLPALARAVLEARRIELDYASWTERRLHNVDPLGLVLKGGDWYLVARGARHVATYRVGAIAALSVSTSTFVPPPDFDLPRWWRAAQDRLEADLFTCAATIRASVLGRDRLARQSPRGRACVAAMTAPDVQGWATGTLLIEPSDHGLRELLGLGPELEVLEPQDLREQLAVLAAGIARLHG